MTSTPRIILASGSAIRREILTGADIPFEVMKPDVDEDVIKEGGRGEGLDLESLAMRLAEAKCMDIASKTNAIVIGSDQIAVFAGRIVGKPGTHPAAKEQLLSFSGQNIEFLTAVSVQCRVTGFEEQYIDSTRVRFRSLQADEIERYLKAETPYDCAGAFKAESLGIVLFESIKSDDPTALIGLPLIRTAAILRRTGLRLP